MSEENKTLELKDEDLQKVTGGSGDKPSCQYYRCRNTYSTCPNPLKGLCQQCKKCELNAD